MKGHLINKKCSFFVRQYAILCEGILLIRSVILDYCGSES